MLHSRKNLFFVICVFSLSTFSRNNNAQAYVNLCQTQNCKCQAATDLSQPRYQLILKSGTKVTFKHVSPRLGPMYAFNDEKLVWSHAVRDKNCNLEEKDQYGAMNLCEEMGARLPTFEEFKNLRKNLGGTHSSNFVNPDYSPFSEDGKEILRDLSTNSFWSGTYYSEEDYGRFWYFFGKDGFATTTYRFGVSALPVICVQKI